jgi:hypothetical protein
MVFPCFVNGYLLQIKFKSPIGATTFIAHHVSQYEGR